MTDLLPEEMPAAPPQRQANLESSDPYAVLDLTRGASQREVKRAYFELVRQHPPEEDAQAFKVIRAAYEKLRTAETQAQTDLILFQPPPPWEPRKRRGKLDLEVHAEDVWLLLQRYGDLGRANFEEDYRSVSL
jgi:curved DNA-binding protein CbpA